jgi:ribosomal subunit interface protein
MDIIFKGRRTALQERFRRHATAKLGKIGKLDQKAIRIDVEVTQERNPRQSDRRERVELTIRSRGPVIRAEAAADDRFVALDLAVAKLEGRLRRACDRRKNRHGGQITPDLGYFLDQFDGQFADDLPVLAADGADEADGGPSADGAWPDSGARFDTGARPAGEASDVPIAMEGDGPLVVREKFHAAGAMTIDQALLEMELVGHDFFLFYDQQCRLPSVVYRRCGYDYGVIRLVEDSARDAAGAATGNLSANGAGQRDRIGPSGRASLGG